jgi:hypothetical protein
MLCAALRDLDFAHRVKPPVDISTMSSGQIACSVHAMMLAAFIVIGRQGTLRKCETRMYTEGL